MKLKTSWIFLCLFFISCFHIKEDCISFNPQTAKVDLLQNEYKIVDGSQWIFSFGTNKDEATQSLKIIKFYGMNSVCYVGRPDPSFQYLRVNKAAPAGEFEREDCVSFNPQTTIVKEFSPADYRIVDGDHAMFAFGEKKKEARDSLYFIKEYGFNKSCFVGRPDPSFQYLRK